MPKVSEHTMFFFLFSIKIPKIQISYLLTGPRSSIVFIYLNVMHSGYKNRLNIAPDVWLEVEAGAEGVCLQFQSPDVTQCHFNYLVISLYTISHSFNTQQEICHAAVHAAMQSWLFTQMNLSVH